MVLMLPHDAHATYDVPPGKGRRGRSDGGTSGRMVAWIRNQNLRVGAQSRICKKEILKRCQDDGFHAGIKDNDGRVIRRRRYTRFTQMLITNWSPTCRPVFRHWQKYVSLALDSRRPSLSPRHPDRHRQILTRRPHRCLLRVLLYKLSTSSARASPIMHLYPGQQFLFALQRGWET